MRPMLSLDALPDSDRFLLWTLLQTALADSSVAPVEAIFIEKAMDVLGLDPASQQQVRAMILGQAAVPALDPAALPAPERRVELFRDTVYLAYSDGVITESERGLLTRLAQALELERVQFDEIWTTARELFEDED